MYVNRDMKKGLTKHKRIIDYYIEKYRDNW